METRRQESRRPGPLRPSRLLLLVFLSALLPLLAGFATFVWWWHTRSAAAARVGAWVVTVGTIVVAVGGSAFAFRLLAAPRPPLRVTVLLALLIAANPVAAYVYSELIIAALKAEREAEMDGPAGPAEAADRSGSPEQAGPGDREAPAPDPVPSRG